MFPNKQDDKTNIEKIKSVLDPVITVFISKIKSKKVKSKEA
ncbi:hypothetical protein Plano_1730 [Planococcus sp. PAMC 21323]|nr:hypothetical protein Plano_1730 [Planococcus sp. PAMC 21323]